MSNSDYLITPSVVKTNVRNFFPVIISCMSPGSTGYHWVLEAMPNCVNLTNMGFDPYAPGMIGSSGIQFFMFLAVTPTGEPPIMAFKLKSPEGKIVQTIDVKVEISDE